ncbi:DUF6531 domain-containing protein [Pelomonas sp. P7]|uniref:DUF6531 domain-containing protein n=1 Tax=Pelomonas caseinilytica TaxID=2906763 RepID=A0ABS8XC82_9BURK|nr:DUF6531 domain-containing protein [Pelomonas sp. P7]
MYSTGNSQAPTFNQVDGDCVTNAQYFFLDGGASIQLPKQIDDVGTETFSPALLFLPKSAELGQTFNSSGSLNWQSAQGSQVVPYTASVTVVGFETITVPAGRFNALHVQQSMNLGAEFNNADDVWLGDGVGEIRRLQRAADNSTTDLQLLESNLVPPGTKDDGDDDDCSKFCGDPINYANGNSFQSNTDLSAGGALQFRRYYNSRAPLLGSLGYGWRHHYERSLYTHLAATPRRVSLSRPNGKWLYFTETSSGSWTSDSDVNFTLTAVYSGGGSNPSSWIVRTPDNELEIYDGGTLISITTMDGFKRDVQMSAGNVDHVVDMFGRSLDFSYRDDGRLSAIGWTGGRSETFDYDAALNLTSVTFADQSGRSYRYNEAGRADPATPAHALTSTVDEATVEDRYWTFDAVGRATSSQKAGGVERVSVQYANTGVVSITDALGTVRQVSFAVYSGVAHPLTFQSKSNQAVIGADASRTYDANGNVASRNDFNGTRTCIVSDPVRNLESVRVEGLGSSANCASYVSAAASLPIGVRKVSTQWHPQWRVPVARALPRKLVYWVYNGQSDPVLGGVASCTLTPVKLPDGRPLAVLCRRHEIATTDSNGSQGFAASKDTSLAARTYQWQYNDFGQVLTVKDPLGNATTNAYYADTTTDHTLGDLNTVTNALNQVVARYTKYDPAGQWLEMVDANGMTTTRTFDLRQRIKSVTTDALSTRFDYWPTGLLKTVTFPDSSTISYGYDNAHRLTSIADDLGNKISYSLDNSGNRVTENVSDPTGRLARTLARVPDALNRIQQVTGRE